MAVRFIDLAAVKLLKIAVIILIEILFEAWMGKREVSSLQFGWGRKSIEKTKSKRNVQSSNQTDDCDKYYHKISHKIKKS